MSSCFGMMWWQQKDRNLTLDLWNKVRHGSNYREFLQVQNEFKCVVTRLFPFWSASRNLDAVNFITSAWFQVPISETLPHSSPCGIRVAGAAQAFCLLLVFPRGGVCSHESYIPQEGHPAPRRKIASPANFDSFTHFPRILFWEAKITFFESQNLKTIYRSTTISSYLQEHFLRFKVVITCEKVWPYSELLINVDIPSVIAVHLYLDRS